MQDISTGGTIAFFVCIIVFYIFLWVYFCQTIMRVNQSQAVILEKFGKFSRVLPPGLHWISFFESPRTVCFKHLEVKQCHYQVHKFHSEYVDMRERILDIPSRSFITRDTVSIQVDALVFYRILDPLIVYAVTNLSDALELLCVSSLRNIVASLTLDETFSSRGSLNTQLKRQLEADCSRYGIEITRVGIEEIIVGQDILKSMEIQKEEERTRISEVITAGGKREIDIIQAKGKAITMVLLAEAKKHSKIARAAGESISKIVRAQAEAECFRLIQNSLKNRYRAADYLYVVQYLQKWKTMATSCNISLIPSSSYQKLIKSQ